MKPFAMPVVFGLVAGCAASPDSKQRLDVGVQMVFPSIRPVADDPDAPGYDDVWSRSPAIKAYYRAALAPPVNYYAGATVAFLAGKKNPGLWAGSWFSDEVMVKADAGFQFRKGRGGVDLYWRTGAGALLLSETEGKITSVVEGDPPVIMTWEGVVFDNSVGFFLELGAGISYPVGWGSVFVDVGYTFGPAPDLSDYSPVGTPNSFDQFTITIGGSFGF